MQTIIGGVDRTSDIIRNSIVIGDELQERINSASFKVGNGDRPEDFQEIKIYESFEIVAVSDAVCPRDLVKNPIV